MASMASSAALGSAGGLVNAEGSVGGGGPKSSSGAALTAPRLTLISITAAMPGLLKKPSNLRSGIFFMLFPSGRAGVADVHHSLSARGAPIVGKKRGRRKVV
ncbi:hypothetical protein D3C81_1525360 [compost metagenome]